MKLKIVTQDNILSKKVPSSKEIKKKKDSESRRRLKKKKEKRGKQKSVPHLYQKCTPPHEHPSCFHQKAQQERKKGQRVMASACNTMSITKVPKRRL